MTSEHGNETVDVLLVCTGGGHLLQLWSLREAWAGLPRAWVVASNDASDVDSLLAGERVYRAFAPASRSLRNLARNLALAQRVLRGLRPRAVVTTGAAVAVPFAWIARLHGVPVVWVETLARVERPSLSCRLAGPAVDRVYVQWPELLQSLPRARYAGTVFASE